MSAHTTEVLSTNRGHLGICRLCGDRTPEFTSQPNAREWCDDHERSPRKDQRGGSPGLKMLERLYRSRSGMVVYTESERAEWLLLADEIADRLKTNNDVIDGQISLFDDEGET